MEIQGVASRRLSLETKNNKTLCAGAKGLGPLPFVGWGLARGWASPRPHPTKGRSSSVGSWPWHKGKPEKQAGAVKVKSDEWREKITRLSSLFTLNSSFLTLFASSCQICCIYRGIGSGAFSLQNSNFSLQKVKSQDNGNSVKENAKVRYERLETGLSGEEKR